MAFDTKGRAMPNNGRWDPMLGVIDHRLHEMEHDIDKYLIFSAECSSFREQIDLNSIIFVMRLNMCRELLHQSHIS